MPGPYGYGRNEVDGGVESELLLDAFTGEFGVEDGPVDRGTPPLPVAHGIEKLPPEYEKGAVGTDPVEVELNAVTGEFGVEAGGVKVNRGILPLPVGNGKAERLPLSNEGLYGTAVYGVWMTTEELFEAVTGEFGVEAGPVDKGTEPDPVGNGKMDLLPAGNEGVKVDEIGTEGKDP